MENNALQDRLNIKCLGDLAEKS